MGGHDPIDPKGMAVGLTVDSPAGVVSAPPGVKQVAQGR